MVINVFRRVKKQGNNFSKVNSALINVLMIINIYKEMNVLINAILTTTKSKKKKTNTNIHVLIKKTVNI